MISAVVPPQPQPLPLGARPPSAPQAATVRERAAAGYFRDLARWLNQPLAPHGIFVQVQADRPGCLRLVVEFEQPPIKEHLLRFLCHRVWQLNSDLIEGICVVARPLGDRQVLWQQRIKITTPALKRRQAALATPPRQRAVASPLPPQLRVSQGLKGLSHQRLQTLRTVVLSGSAVAAFVMGCLLETMLTGPAPALPQFAASSEVNPAGGVTGGADTAESFPSQGRGGAVPVIARGTATSNQPAGNRPTVVDTALEPVGVMTHQPTTPGPSSDVTLLFGGDISLDDIDPKALTAPGGFFADVAEYGQADIALVNLATPLTKAATNLQEELRHQTRTDAVDLLVNSGVDMVNLTHSRLMDYGAAGLDETLTTLDSKGLYRIGAGRNALEARRPEVLDVNGKRIAYLSYAMGGNDAAHDTALLKERAATGDPEVAREVKNFKAATAFKDRAGFNAQNMPEIVADIQSLRDEVDWIIVNFRWVDNLSEQPNFMQTNLARLAIDQGADVVVGYHPTVIQGGEIYKGRPIAYSLGDFVFRPNDPIESQDSAVLKVSLKDDQMQVELIPVRVRDSRPKTLTGADREAVLQRIEQASSQFDQPLKSPVVLDLKRPAVSPETVSDPNSPFVSPEAADILPVKTKPQPPIQPQDPAESRHQGVQPLPEETTPRSEVSEPTVPPKLEPELEPELEIEFNEDLPEWGTKVSPRQRQFKPVPTQRSGSDRSSAEPSDSQLQTHLWGEPVETLALLVNPRPSAGPEPGALAWADALPETPGSVAVE